LSFQDPLKSTPAGGADASFSLAQAASKMTASANCRPRYAKTLLIAKSTAFALSIAITWYMAVS
jgi:hypothetical protein